MEFIDLKSQYKRLKPSINARIDEVLEHGQYIMGPEVKRIEEALAALIGAKYCIAVANGTDALLLAMMALKIKAGDEVITSPFTFIANGETIKLLGAKPIFVDIDPKTYNLDPTQIEAVITEHTKAILPVSLFGQCADMDAINAIAEKYQIPVIEDAAQSLGAIYKGRNSGNLSTIACTSFFPTKPLGCYGDGGACFTNDEHLAEDMQQIRVHGQEKRYHHRLIGMNSRLDTLQAAILLAKLEIFPEDIANRERVAERYTALLKDWVITPYIAPYNRSVYSQYTLRVDARSQIQQHLKAAGIPTAVHYPIPLHLQQAFADLHHRQGDFPCAEAAANAVLSLPMHPYLSLEDQDRIVEALKKIIVQ